MKASSDAAVGSRVVQKTRIKAILFLILALMAGLGVVYLVRWYLARAEQLISGSSATTAQVVTAGVDIPIGTVLTEQHLALSEWPVKNVPEGAFGGVKTLVGRTVITNLLKGEPLVQTRLADQSAGRGMAAILAKGTRGMAVKVDQVVGVAGFVQPGDYVDVITTMTPDEETRKDLKQEAARISKIILQNIKVLAVGEQTATSGAKPVKVQVVTLEVNPEQTERLALATRHGEIQLTIRSRIDQDQVPTAGITPVQLLAPDDGAEVKDKVVAAAAAPRVIYRTVRRPEKKVEEKPEAPVVEILRGDRVEERKLRPTADSKK